MVRPAKMKDLDGPEMWKLLTVDLNLVQFNFFFVNSFPFRV